MGRRLAGWELVFAAIAAIGAGFVMPIGFYGDCVSELVTVLGFLAAAFVPVMVLASTSVRAGGFSVLRIRALGAAIEQQVKLFGGLFIYSIVTCAILIGGKLLKWSLPKFAFKIMGYSCSINMSLIFPAILTFLLVFLLLRSLTFVGGVISILRLTISIAENEARARDRELRLAGLNDLDNYRVSENHGTRIDAA